MSIGAGLSLGRSFHIDQKEAELLMSFVLKKSREFVVAHSEFEFEDISQRALTICFEKRASGMPIAYITGRKEFFGRDFFVNENVLIPRPETELLVESALGLCEKTRAASICDVGTGSGCIALSLARARPKLRITAVDISEGSLTVARRNAALHKISSIDFLQSNLLAAVMEKPFDGIVANLPYVGFDEIDSVETDVVAFEPRHAVFAGQTGFELFEKLFEQASQMLHRPLWMALEIGFAQKNRIAQLIKKYFGDIDVVWKNDLAGIPRVITFFPPCLKN